MARIGPRNEGLRSWSKKTSEEISPKRKSWAVTVVPMFAPIIIPTVCVRRMMPAFTITVVAAELWMSPVTSAPSSTPLKTLFVRRSKMLSRRPLESFSKPSVMVAMPNKNMAMAPSIVTIFEISNLPLRTRNTICVFFYIQLLFYAVSLIEV